MFGELIVGTSQKQMTSLVPTFTADVAPKMELYGKLYRLFSVFQQQNKVKDWIN